MSKIKKTSIYKGVSWCEQDQRWRVAIYYNGRQHGLGNFKTEKEAYDIYAKVSVIIHPKEKIKNLKGEKWIKFELCGNFYSISNKGRLISFNYRNSGRERLILPQINNRGYSVFLVNKKTYFIHVLVAKYFLGERDMQVNHIDLNRSNNCVENLEYVTNRGNVCHGLLSKKGQYLLGTCKRRNGKFGSEITVRGKRIWLGTCDTEMEAHQRYLDALLKYGFTDDYNYIRGLLDSKSNS
jgi:hypothetical protein